MNDDHPHTMQIIHPPGTTTAVRLFEDTSPRTGRQLVADLTVGSDGRPALQFVSLDHHKNKASRITWPASLVRELHRIADAFEEHERERAMSKPKRDERDGLALRARIPKDDTKGRT